MRIVTCGLIVGAIVLGTAPMAMADEPVGTSNGTSSESPVSESPATPQAEVSMLAVSLTVGGAVAMAGSGAALVLARRRGVSPPS